MVADVFGDPHGDDRGMGSVLDEDARRSATALSSVLKLRLPIAAVTDLLQGAKETVAATVIASNANGTSHSTTTIAPLTQQRRSER